MAPGGIGYRPLPRHFVFEPEGLRGKAERRKEASPRRARSCNQIVSMHSRIARILLTALPPVVLLVCALPTRVTSLSDGPIDSAVRDLSKFLINPETQWIAFLCACVYFAISISLYRNPEQDRGSRRCYTPAWLAATVLIAAASYGFSYSDRKSVV